MTTIKNITSTDKVEIFEVSGLPHNPMVNVGIELAVSELVNKHQNWMFNRYTCNGNPFEVLIQFYKD